MFAEWLQEHKFENTLLSKSEFKAYPTITDREAWDNVNPAVVAQSMESAEEYYNYDWPMIKATEFMAYNRVGDRIMHQAPYYQRRRALIDLVVAECMENKGRFVDDIINGVWCICEETFWGISAHNGVYWDETPYLPDIETPFIDLFAAETGALMAWILHLMEDVLAKEEYLIVRRIKIELQKRIIDPFMLRMDFPWMCRTFVRINNWTPWILSNVLSVFLLVETDEKRKHIALTKMFNIMDCFINICPPDGGCDEGPGYWNVAGGALFDFVEQLYIGSDGKINFFDNAHMREIACFVYRAHINENYFINFADGSAKTNISHDMVYRFGKRINEPKMMAMAAYAANFHIEEKKSGDNTPFPLRRRLPEIFNYDEMTEASKTAKAPLERDAYLPNIQVIAAREQEGSAKGLFLAVKGGHNDESHNHNDIGNYIVYLDGKPALIDAGVASYTKDTFSANRYKLWTMQSAYHSLPTINGVMQKDGKQYAASDVSYEMTDEKVKYSLNIQNAYQEEAKLNSCRRNFIFDRADKAEIEVTDVYDFACEENTLGYSFMTWDKPEVEDGKLKVNVECAGCIYVELPAGYIDIEFEHKETKDEKLSGVWGTKGVWRTYISYEKIPQTDNKVFKIYKA